MTRIGPDQITRNAESEAALIVLANCHYPATEFGRTDNKPPTDDYDHLTAATDWEWIEAVEWSLDRWHTYRTDGTRQF